MDVYTLLQLFAVCAIAYKAFMIYRRSFFLPLQGKAILITGCDTGFGNATAKLLDERGAQVIAICLTEEGAKSLKESTSMRLTTIVGDVTNDTSVEKAAKLVQEQYPNGLWGIVNNAGVLGVGNVELCPMDSYQRAIEVNYLGMVRVTKAFLPMIRNSKGRIVNVTSVAGRLSSLGMSAYSASKFAAEAFSDALRQEMMVWGVKVCLIEPGFFQTPLTNLVNLEKALRKNWDMQPSTTKSDYGEAYLESTAKGMCDMINSLASKKPIIVANEIAKALSQVHPKKRYVVGIDARILWANLSRFPAVFIDVFLNAVTRLAQPAALVQAKKLQ